MPKYIYNANVDDKGNHEVHDLTCPHLPDVSNRESIGTFMGCRQAILAAKIATGKNNFDGCKHCSPDCHKG